MVPTGWTRTTDLSLTKRLLYHLSYEGESVIPDEILGCNGYGRTPRDALRSSFRSSQARVRRKGLDLVNAASSAPPRARGRPVVRRCSGLYRRPGRRVPAVFPGRLPPPLLTRDLPSDDHALQRRLWTGPGRFETAALTAASASTAAVRSRPAATRRADDLDLVPLPLRVWANRPRLGERLGPCRPRPGSSRRLERVVHHQRGDAPIGDSAPDPAPARRGRSARRPSPE